MNRPICYVVQKQRVLSFRNQIRHSDVNQEQEIKRMNTALKLQGGSYTD